MKVSQVPLSALRRSGRRSCLGSSRTSCRVALAAVSSLLILSGCTTVDLSVRDDARRPSPSVPASVPAPVAAPSTSTSSSVPPVTGETKKPGGYYLDDGPAEQIPEGLLDLPDAEPKIEPYARGPSKPYTVFEKTYVPITDERPFVQRGRGSWYGKKFHGQRTASGEIYDMFKMTAAHPTLPIPSYARVTNLRNGKQVIVRINDRGPFHSERIIDVSYTAALKLGYVQSGSAELEVERLLPEEIVRLHTEKRSRPPQANASATPAEDPIAKLAAGGSPPVAAESGGIFLQFGAYAQIQNAQSMRERLLSGWPAELPPPAVVQSGGLYRLHSGPFPSREQAAAAAQQLKRVSQISTAIVQR